MNHSRFKAIFIARRCFGVSYRVSLLFWACTVSLAGLGMLAVWPRPYVAPDIDSIWSKPDADGVRRTTVAAVDDFMSARAEVHAQFEMKRVIACLLSGILGWSTINLSVHLCAQKDASLFLAFICAAAAMTISDWWLPPDVNAEGYQDMVTFPWWISPLIPIVIGSVCVGAILFPLRVLTGRLWRSKVPSDVNDVTPARR